MVRPPAQYWRMVVIPVMWPSFLGTVILLFANAFGAVATAYALTGPSLNIVPIQLFAQIRGDVLLQSQSRLRAGVRHDRHHGSGQPALHLVPTAVGALAPMIKNGGRLLGLDHLRPWCSFSLSCLCWRRSNFRCESVAAPIPSTPTTSYSAIRTSRPHSSIRSWWQSLRSVSESSWWCRLPTGSGCACRICGRSSSSSHCCRWSSRRSSSSSATSACSGRTQPCLSLPRRAAPTCFWSWATRCWRCPICTVPSTRA